MTSTRPAAATRPRRLPVPITGDRAVAALPAGQNPSSAAKRDPVAAVQNHKRSVGSDAVDVAVNAYAVIEEKIAADRCVVLDGGVATELQRYRTAADLASDLWGTWALYRAPRAVLDVHRSYVQTGCDVVSTDTWSILSAPDAGSQSRPTFDASHWLDGARAAVRLARQAIDDGQRADECAVAFAISEEAHTPERRETLELLLGVLEDEPPDLILLETLTLIREPSTYDVVERLLGTRLPVWLSFRRCRHGVCGVQGQHWGPPEGDQFGRAARRFERMGVGALLINCLPIDHVPGMITWLRDFTSLPLGVYPNLGDYTGTEWRFDERVDPADYASVAREWREEGAQIIGGCCGVTPDHISRLVTELAGTPRGERRVVSHPIVTEEVHDLGSAAAWKDSEGRDLYPLPFLDLTVEPGVFTPTTGSYLVWKTLFTSGAGAARSCLDVGCGCGILAVQLALNGATNVHAIDIDRNAVANTLANAFRNGVAGRVTGEAVNFYYWRPPQRYDLVVASLYQMPVDPYRAPTGHRPPDFWGRSLIDHFIRLLPHVLAEDGVAYLMQLSIIGQVQTEALLAERGFAARVVDFTFFPFGPIAEENREQIARVEQLSDAYHINVADDDVMVAYVLEIARADH
jgi:S-methylmethionine-dependent homocysteine/selenocysteine methylase/SAM-dependent methyltransferase